MKRVKTGVDRFEGLRGPLKHGYVNPWISLCLLTCGALLLLGLVIVMLTLSGDLEQRAGPSNCIKLGHHELKLDGPIC